MRRLTIVCALLTLLAQRSTAFSSPSFKSLEESWNRMQRRASNVTIPSAIDIAPSQYWDGNDGPWSSFPLQIGGGSNSQNVRVMISTAAYNVWTIGDAGCPSGWVPDCTDSRGFLFLPNQSLTWIPNSKWGTSIESNLDLSTTAPAGYDSVTLGWQGSGGPMIEHTVVFNVYDERYWLGLFGLNPKPTNFSTLNNPQPSFMQQLYDNGAIPSRSYGYTAGSKYRLNSVYGSLTLGGYNQNRFTGGISFPFYEDISRDLVVNIKSISTDGGGSTSDLLPDGQIAAYVDSTVSQIWLPESACEAFETAFGLTYNSTAKMYLVDGNLHSTLVAKNPNVTFTLTNGNQTVDIVLPYGAFNLNVSQPLVQSSSYYFPLQRAANDTQYTLGRAFLQEAFLIADYDRSNFTIAPCIWDQSKVTSGSIMSILSPNLTAIAAQQSANASGSGVSAGLIAGVVVAIVVVAILAIALAIFFLRKRKRERRRRAELNEKIDGADSYNSSPYAQIFGGELGEGDVRELDSRSKLPTAELDSPHKHPTYGVNELPGGGFFTAYKNQSHEMDGTTPVYEMFGSDVHEMSALNVSRPDHRNDLAKRG